jgi:ParB family chromosome partitioning protein
MGRGLAAILSATPGYEGEELRDLPIDLIAPNARQPRRHFDEEALVGLAESIKTRGVLQPVLVRPVRGGGFELIAGERRWRAAGLAGLETVPALVRERADAEALEIALIENMAREDLNPIEEARACAALVEELGLTRAEVGRRVGRSRVAVSNLLRLLDLPDEALDLIERRALSEGHGRALLLAPDHGDRRRLAHAAVEGGWSVRELEARARTPSEPQIRVRRTREQHPDLEAALTVVADAVGAALGAEARASARGSGCRVELSFDSLQDALALVERLAERPPGSRPRAIGSVG